LAFAGPMSRAAAAAAVEKIVHKASEETRRLEDLKVFVFKLQVDCVTFDGGDLASTRGLRFAISTKEKSDNKCLFTPPIKPMVEGDRHRRCVFNIRYEVDMLWEGSDVMIFSVYQANLFFSSSFLGSCEMPLSLCYEQLVSAAQSCNPSEAEPLPIELDICFNYRSKPISGRCCLYVSCSKETLRDIGGRHAVRLTCPEPPPGEQDSIHSEAIRHKMREIYECHSLSSQLQKAQANLWMHGVERLTTEGTLDSQTVEIARACGLVDQERAKLIRQSSATSSKLSRSGSFSESQHGNEKWLHFTAA